MEVDDGADRRLAEIDSSAVLLIPWQEARKQLAERVER